MRDKQISDMQNLLWCRVKFLDSDESATIAEALYNAGYRKAEDVAREIFEEIEKVVNYSLCVDINDWSAYTELKKKYTEGK